MNNGLASSDQQSAQVLIKIQLEEIKRKLKLKLILNFQKYFQKSKHLDILDNFNTR